MPKTAPLLHCYNRLPIDIVGGKGVMLHGKWRKRYLDFSAGIAVNSLGHQHPALVKAVKKQGKRAWHTANLFHLPLQQAYAKALTKAANMDIAFFCSSGLEAVETAIKLARQYQYTRQPERIEIISLTNGFHGRSYASLSAGGNSIAREGFGPLLEGFTQIEAGNIDALKNAISERTAAILLEPIQAEGGIHVLPKDYLQQVAALATEHNVLLIADEVQCGFGRTGTTLFHSQKQGISPDIIACAKGMGGGFPLAGCLMKQAVADCITPGMHGSTYGGNLLGMRIGLAVLHETQKRLKHVEKMGVLLRDELEQLQALHPDHIAEIRGEGLLMGVALQQPIARDIVEKAASKGLIITACGSNQVLRLTPPLIIQESHIQSLHRILNDIFLSL